MDTVDFVGRGDKCDVCRRLLRDHSHVLVFLVPESHQEAFAGQSVGGAYSFLQPTSRKTYRFTRIILLSFTGDSISPLIFFPKNSQIASIIPG